MLLSEDAGSNKTTKIYFSYSGCRDAVIRECHAVAEWEFEQQTKADTEVVIV
eukprot:IDg15257t1